MKRAMTIYYRENDGELDRIVESDFFKSEDGLMRCDVLKDIIYELDERYGVSHKSMTKDWEKIIKENNDQQETEKTN
jgi:hypothetical protein